MDKKIRDALILPNEPKETPLSTKKHAAHNRFKCAQCDEKLDIKNCPTNHNIFEHGAYGEVFNCDICDFSTSREIRIQAHTSRRHQQIEQLDGMILALKQSIQIIQKLIGRRTTWGLAIKDI